MSESTVQVQPNFNRNPAGKGGFGENPHHINPGGKPSQKPFTEAYRAIGLMTDAEYLAYKSSPTRNQNERKAIAMFEATGRNFVQAMREITDRVEGSVRANDSQPTQIGIQVVMVDDWKQITADHSNDTFELSVGGTKLLEAKKLEQERTESE